MRDSTNLGIVLYTGRLYDYQKERIRAGLRSIGLTPREPEEEFYVGRVNYAKGVRLKAYA